MVASQARTVRPDFLAESAQRSARPTSSDDAVGRPPRPETPARWSAALARATEAGVDVLTIGGDATRVAVESASVPGTIYVVNTAGTTCSCPAAQAGDAVCLHRALARFLVGAMDEAGRPYPCPACRGGGVEYDPAVEKCGGLHPTCLACRGSGFAA